MSRVIREFMIRYARRPRKTVAYHRTIVATSAPSDAVADLIHGLLKPEIWWRLALYDIKQRFQRSIIGPLWLTISMGVMVSSLGFVLSTISRVELQGILPHIALGVICWGLLSSCVNEGSSIYTASAAQIRNVPIELSLYLFRMIARNVVIFAFNMMIYVIILVIFPPPIGPNFLLIVPGFILFLLNTVWASLTFGVLAARYRDIPQIVANILQVLFVITPVFWSTETLPDRPVFVTFNPAFHLLEIVRKPLLGEDPSALSWTAATAFAIVGWIATIMLYRRAYSRIAYWV
jgi:lipopolysaccharide transport system permease protein